MAKPKLTKKTLEQAVALKREGLNDCDIAAAKSEEEAIVAEREYARLRQANSRLRRKVRAD